MKFQLQVFELWHLQDRMDKSLRGVKPGTLDLPVICQVSIPFRATLSEMAQAQLVCIMMLAKSEDIK